MQAGSFCFLSRFIVHGLQIIFIITNKWNYKATWKGEQAVQQLMTDFNDMGMRGPGPQDDDPEPDDDDQKSSAQSEIALSERISGEHIRGHEKLSPSP